MARPLRIEFPGALYHVMSRGNERRDIVGDHADCEKWVDWLRRTVETYGWRLHAFVLMTDHYHLFVETPKANLSTGMQFLNGIYASYFNRRHRRAGHLFQGRFKGQLIEEEGYFLVVSRYIHLNPVRAGMVDRPEDYRFSSYPGYHYKRKMVPWITYDVVLREFSSDENQSRRLHRQFVTAGIAESGKAPWGDAWHGLVLGSDSFLQRVKHLVADREADASVPQLGKLRDRPSLERIAEVVAAEFGCEDGAWSENRRSDNASRAMAAYLARRVYGYPCSDVAASLGYRSHGSIAHAVARVERGNDDLQETARRIQSQLTKS